MMHNEAKEILDLVLHPVRMRILMLLSGSQGLTPQQMAEGMNDVPQATLYRHINRLAQAGILSVTAERPVRGTLEKVYALNTGSSSFAGEDPLQAFNRLSKEEHLRYFTAFTMTLLDDFSRYLNSGKSSVPDFAADGVGYHKLAIYLSDEEMTAFTAAVNQALLPFLTLPDAPGRKKRLFSNIMMPANDQVRPQDNSKDSYQQEE